MISDNPPALPAPFPTRAFVAIGIVWVLIDLPMILFVSDERLAIIWRLWNSNVIWFPLFAARVMLLLGWWMLGEGTLAQRFSGILLFAPLLGTLLIRAYVNRVIIDDLILIFVALPFLCFPYVFLPMSDCELTRDAPRIHESKPQFSLRQLMLLTLLIAVILGLLRWMRAEESRYGTYLFLGIIFCWFYPLVALFGFLRERLYPGAWYAIAATFFVIVLPLTLEESGYVIKEQAASFLAIYLFFIAGHILLLRYLGFRLVQGLDPPFHFVPTNEGPSEKPSDPSESIESPRGSPYVETGYTESIHWMHHE